MTKVSPEVLKTLQDLQETYTTVVKSVGELRFQELLLNKEKTKLDNVLLELEERRKQIVDDIQKTFGSTGVVDMQTGEFTPTK